MKFFIKIILLFIIPFAHSQEKADWLLSEKGRIDKLSKKTRNMIIPELDKMGKDYTAGAEDLFNDQVEVTVVTGSYVDSRLSAEGLPPHLARVNTYGKEKQNRFIYQEFKVIEKKPTWSEVVSYAGGYSEVGKKGYKKENLDDFKLTYTLKTIEIKTGNKAVAKVLIEGEDFARQYYNVDDKSILINGTYSFPKITYTDIYNMAKNGVIRKKIKYKGPQVKFTFGNILKDKNISLNLYRLDDSYAKRNSPGGKKGAYIGSDFNDIFVENAVSIKEAMVTMINDLVSKDEYDNLEHRKTLISENKSKSLLNEQITEDRKKADNQFMASFLAVNDLGALKTGRFILKAQKEKVKLKLKDGTTLKKALVREVLTDEEFEEEYLGEDGYEDYYNHFSKNRSYKIIVNYSGYESVGFDEDKFMQEVPSMMASGMSEQEIEIEYQKRKDPRADRARNLKNTTFFFDEFDDDSKMIISIKSGKL